MQDQQTNLEVTITQNCVEAIRQEYLPEKLTDDQVKEYAYTLKDELRAVCLLFQEQFGSLPTSWDYLDHSDGHTYQATRFIKHNGDTLSLEIVFDRLPKLED